MEGGVGLACVGCGVRRRRFLNMRHPSAFSLTSVFAPVIRSRFALSSLSCSLDGVLDKAEHVSARVKFLYCFCIGLSWLPTCSVGIGWLCFGYVLHLGECLCGRVW
jgi:hypothetical protein